MPGMTPGKSGGKVLAPVGSLGQEGWVLEKRVGCETNLESAWGVWLGVWAAGIPWRQCSCRMQRPRLLWLGKSRGSRPRRRRLPKCKGGCDCGEQPGEAGTPSLNERLLGVVGAAAWVGGLSLWTQEQLYRRRGSRGRYSDAREEARWNPGARQSGFPVDSGEITETNLPCQHSPWLWCSVCSPRAGPLISNNQ